MPLYEFQGPDGQIIQLFYRVKNCPASVVRAGKRYKRIISTSIQVVKSGPHNRYPYISTALPRYLPGCEHTPDGKPIIHSKFHEGDVARQHGMEKINPCDVQTLSAEEKGRRIRKKALEADHSMFQKQFQMAQRDAAQMR